MKLAIALGSLVLLFSNAAARGQGVTKSLTIARNGQTPTIHFVDEGDVVQFQYLYEIEVIRQGDRFIANRPPQPRNGTIRVPTGELNQFGQPVLETDFLFNVTDNATTASGGLQFVFVAMSEGDFRVRMDGSVSLERNFDDFVGTFSLNTNSGNLIRVRNLDPVVTNITGDLAVGVGEQFPFFVSATDPGNDPLTVRWDFDDDGIFDDFQGASGFGSFGSAGRYPVAVEINDGDGGVVVRDFIITVTPGVQDVFVNVGSPSRSQISFLVVAFDSVIDSVFLSSAFRVTNIDTSVEVGSIAVDTLVQNDQTFAFLTFDGASTVPRLGAFELGNSLEDGNYRLDVIASSIRLSGQDIRMQSDHVFGGQTSCEPNDEGFFRLFGDEDGDGDTDLDDLNNSFVPALFSLLGGENYSFTLDGEGDGDVDLDDLNDFLVPNLFKTRR